MKEFYDSFKEANKENNILGKYASFCGAEMVSVNFDDENLRFTTLLIGNAKNYSKEELAKMEEQLKHAPYAYGSLAREITTTFTEDGAKNTYNFGGHFLSESEDKYIKGMNALLVKYAKGYKEFLKNKLETVEKQAEEFAEKLER